MAVRRARASGCSTCSSCCWSSVATSARTGSGRSSTRTPAPDAFEKMFERDKEELRSLGVPIEVGQMDAYFDDEPGYRVQADQLVAPGHQPDRRRGRRRRAGHQGLAARQAGPGHHRGGPQAHRAGRRPGRLGPGHRRAAAQRRRAVVRRLPRGHAGAAGGDLRLPQAGPDRVDHPPPPAVGGHPLLRPLVRRRLRHRPRRRARVPALAGRGAAPEGGRGRGLRGPATTWTSARSPGGSRPRSPPSGWCCSCARAPGCRCVAAADVLESGVTGPDGAAGWDRLAITRGSTGYADEILAFGPDVVVEGPAEVRQRVVDRLTAALTGAGS